MEPTHEQVRAMQAADAARMVLDNPLVKDTLEKIENTIVGAWMDLGIESKAQAEELKRMLHAARQFRAIFEVTIAGGSVAKNELLNAETMEVRRDAARRRMYG